MIAKSRSTSQLFCLHVLISNRYTRTYTDMQNRDRARYVICSGEYTKNRTTVSCTRLVSAETRSRLQAVTEREEDSKPFFCSAATFPETWELFQELKAGSDFGSYHTHTKKNCPATKVLVFIGLQNTGVEFGLLNFADCSYTRFARILHNSHF